MMSSTLTIPYAVVNAAAGVCSHGSWLSCSPPQPRQANKKGMSLVPLNQAIYLFPALRPPASDTVPDAMVQSPETPRVRLF